jgi:hypothetical protein
VWGCEFAIVEDRLREACREGPFTAAFTLKPLA